MKKNVNIALGKKLSLKSRNKQKIGYDNEGYQYLLYYQTYVKYSLLGFVFLEGIRGKPKEKKKKVKLLQW